MKEIKVALVGAGGMGGVHSNVYKAFPDVRVIAVVDVCREKAEKAAREHDARVYESFDDMLDKEKPDIVDICTPSYLHPEMAIKAAKKKINVLSEKPMALDLKKAREMLKTAEENGIQLMVAQVLRFWSEYVYLKKLYDEGTYGKLRQARFTRISERPRWSWENWMMDKRKSGLCPLDLHIHDADFILHAFGKPKKVKSFGMEEGEIISYISANYLYDGMIIQAESAWYDSPIPFSMSYRVAFDRAVLEFADNKLILYPLKGEQEEVKLESLKEMDTGINISSVEGYYAEIKYFLDCIRNNEKPQISSPESTLESIELVLRELESVQTGKTIGL